MYTEENKREFIDLVFGQWKYFADTKSMTKDILNGYPNQSD